MAAHMAKSGFWGCIREVHLTVAKVSIVRLEPSYGYVLKLISETQLFYLLKDCALY